MTSTDERWTILRGHGLTSAGTGGQEAVLHAIPRLGSAFDHETAWRHEPAGLR
jgi:hypothetical protein